MKPIDPAPTLVLFDLDDTLCDYAGARRQRLQIAFTLAADFSGGTIMADQMQSLVARSIEMSPHGTDHFSIILQIAGIDSGEAAQRAADWYRHNRFHGLQLFDDAIESLVAIRGALPGRCMGMITNGPVEVQSAKLDLLDLRRFFDFILISEEFGSAKPESLIFQEALRLGNAQPGQTVYVGDSAEYDMAGARNSGIAGVWMNRSGATWPDDQPQQYVVNNLAQVSALLG